MNYQLERLFDRYDPENDLVQGAPCVTHTDYVLAELANDALSQLAQLTQRMTALEQQVADLLESSASYLALEAEKN